MNKDTANQGGVTIPLLYCVFNGAESITHYPVEFDRELYKLTPNLYAVCIADNSVKRNHIVGGLLIKTTFTHDDPGFVDAVTAAALNTTILNHFIGKGVSFFPAHLGVAGDEPLSEGEMVRLMLKQYIKFSAGGNA
jgi:hypothetical protein